MPERNRDVLRTIMGGAEWPSGVGPDVCEWNPARQALARLKDPYHGLASVRMIYLRDGSPCHACPDCAELALSQHLLARAGSNMVLAAKPVKPGHVQPCGGAA
jgi:hypothetical protein